MSESWMRRAIRGLKPDIGAATSPRVQIKDCFAAHIIPALSQVAVALNEQGHTTALRYGDDWAAISAENFNGLPLVYAAQGRVYRQPVVNMTSLADERSLKRYPRIAISRGGRTREYSPQRCRRQAVERAARKHYHRFLMATSRG